MSGRSLVISGGYRGLTPSGVDAPRGRRHASPEAERWTLRGSRFALEVIGQIGYRRFWNRWIVTQSHERLPHAYPRPLSEREGLSLRGGLLVWQRCPSHLRREEPAASDRRPGLYLSRDALQPEKGHRALDIVREWTFGWVLPGGALLSADHPTLEGRGRRPVKKRGSRIRGGVSAAAEGNWSGP